MKTNKLLLVVGVLAALGILTAIPVVTGSIPFGSVALAETPPAPPAPGDAIAPYGLTLGQMQGMMAQGGGMMGGSGFGGMMGNGTIGGMMGGMMGGGFGSMMAGGGPVMPEVAKALGMDSQKLWEELRSGKTLVEIAKARGISEDDLKAKMLAAHKAFLDKAVEAGALTKEQAEGRQKWMESQADFMLKGQMPCFGGGPTGGTAPRGGVRGMMRGFRTAPTI